MKKSVTTNVRLSVIELVLPQTKNASNAVKIECNYANNYYGDQMCTVSSKTLKKH